MTPQEIIQEAYNDENDVTAWLIDPLEVADEIEVINKVEEE